MDHLVDKDPPSTSNMGDTRNIPLPAAAAKGHLVICSAIIDTLSNINARNTNGITPLFCAVQRGHLKICQLIIANVEEKNMPDNMENTPFTLLVQIFRQQKN